MQRPTNDEVEREEAAEGGGGGAAVAAGSDGARRRLPLPELRARFAVLLCLNDRLARLLPLVDLTLRRSRGLVTTDPAALRFPSALGRRLAALRGLVLTRVKLAFWAKVLGATVEYTTPAGDLYDRPDNFPEWV